MTSYNINIFNEEYFLFSVSENDAKNGYASPLLGNTVILSPSLCADIRVDAYSSTNRSFCEHYAAALCAAAFIILKRGLPLGSLITETPNGNIEIFNTGRGVFSVNIIKCKVLYTKTVEIMGCDLSFYDVDLGFPVRAIPTSSLDGFDVNAIPLCLLFGNRLPCAVVVYEMVGDVVKFRRFDTHSKYKISDIAAFAAVSAAIGASSGLSELIMYDKSAVCKLGHPLEIILKAF